MGLQPRQYSGFDSWCQGCDNLWRFWSMGWTETGLYLCVECRLHVDVDVRRSGVV